MMATSLRSARVLLQSKDAVRWRSKDAAAFERNTDAVEDFYYYGGSQNARNGRRHLDLTVTARLRVDPQADIQPDHARAAWVTLQQKHPALASYVHGSKRIYTRMDEEEQMKKWLNKTFVVLPDEEEITPEVLDSLPATDMPAMHFLPDAMTFALRTPHHLMDALGTVMLLNDFLTELSRTLLGEVDTTQDDQPVDLACSLKEAASLPSASIAQRARLWNIRRRWLRSYPTIGVVPDQECPQSGLSSWRDLEYTPGETKDIIAKAKKHKMSVTHVIHAGVAFAAKEYGPFQLTRNYNSVILVDMRRRFTDESARQRHALAPQHAMWPVSVQVTSFWKTAELLKNEYQELVKDPDLPALVEPVYAETIPGASAACPTFHSAPIFGNCGRIDDRLESAYDGFTVDDFSLATECSGEEIVMAVWTYQGKLRIRAMFNEGFHSAKSIEQYMWLTEVALKDGLGVGKVHSWWP